jgi:predicted transcriptional regulator
MTQNHQDWEKLGRDIQDVVDRAVKSQDYQKLNQTVRQTVEKAVNTGANAVHRAARTVSRPAPAKAVHTQKPVPEQKNLPVLYGKTGGKTAGGILQIVGGSCVTFFTLLGSLLSWLISVISNGSIFFGGLPLVWLALGGGLMYNGIRILNRLSRFKAYRKQLGQKTHCSLEALARSVKRSTAFVKKELQSMIRQGLFLEGHLDKEETMLITSHETWRYFEQSRLQLEERRQQQALEEARKQEAAAKLDPRVREVLDKGNFFLSQLRCCNDAIPGAVVSEKISRMEDIVRRIFQRAEADPEVIPDLKKLMNYYLPMTVKLLNAYADMDAQNPQGEIILASKKEIEDTLDTLNLAYEKLLDDLFEETALDVSSDISVLQTMLAQEGLTEDEFTKMRKNGGN